MSTPAPSQEAPQRGEEHQDYFARVIPEPFQILGIRLLPLSLGRYRLLKRFEIAFVSDTEGAAEVGDLLAGILICSMRCDEFLAWAESPRFSKDIRRWSRRLLPAAGLCSVPFFGKRWRQRHSFNVVEKMQLFQRYIAEGSKVPDYFDESGHQLRSGAHWSQAIEVTLRSEVGWTDEEINEQPLTKALSDYFKFAENQGLVRLMTPADVEQGLANAAIYEQIFAGAGDPLAAAGEVSNGS
jgi:hypothetical protein